MYSLLKSHPVRYPILSTPTPHPPQSFVSQYPIRQPAQTISNFYPKPIPAPVSTPSQPLPEPHPNPNLTPSQPHPAFQTPSLPPSISQSHPNHNPNPIPNPSQPHPDPIPIQHSKPHNNPIPSLNFISSPSPNQILTPYQPSPNHIPTPVQPHPSSIQTLSQSYPKPKPPQSQPGLPQIQLQPSSNSSLPPTP